MFAIRRLFRSLAATGLIFTARVIKRGEGREVRHFHAVPVNYDAENDLLTVYDRHAEGYRSIALEGVLSVNAFGVSYSFT
jgi:hypothetical protein